MNLYHYTDASGHAEIKRTNVIRRSQRGQQRDGIFGDGVYLTSLDPHDHNKEEIARNNWNNGWRANLGKSDYYIEIEMSSLDRDLLEANNSDGRDVYIYKSDIDLDDFVWKSGKNSEWTITGAVLGGVAAAGAIVGGIMLLGSLLSSNDGSSGDESKKRRK